MSKGLFDIGVLPRLGEGVLEFNVLALLIRNLRIAEWKVGWEVGSFIICCKSFQGETRHLCQRDLSTFGQVL